MAPFSKPETVLKQAEGLVSVGQTHAALQSLSEMFASKKFRMTPLTSLEPIMHRFIDLCVEMRKGRTAKEGLMQFKNIAQNTNVQSIEVVITRFVQLADAKVREAQEKAAVKSAVDVDDLEASETPESILLGAVSGDQNKDRTDRALVTPWLKFLWESYRTSLETLKNNARLEAIYQQIAQQAFTFCLKYSRKVEFRRLCETLRLHLSNVAKYPNQPHAINLSDPDTLQHHLETRFAQLNTSVELELWQEAFRSVEDVHNLLTMAKKAPRPAMMANYYEKLTKIFLMSGNALYHAAAWCKYYAVVVSIGGKSEEELGELAAQVLVSALAVPVGLQVEEQEELKGRNARLTSLLALTKMPTRAGLLKDALSRDVLKLSPSTIKSLYKILEVTFDPLTLCVSVAPLLKQLSSQEAYSPYLPLLQKALLSRLLLQLSEVYSTIDIASLHRLVSPLREAGFEGAFDEEQIESYIMGCARRGELNIHVDHKDGVITFDDKPFMDEPSSLLENTSSEASVQPTMADLVKTRLSRIATCLHSSLAIIEPTESRHSLSPEGQAERFKSLVAAVEVERRALRLRRALVAKRRELLSELSVRKEKEETSRRAEISRREKEEEERRKREELRRKEQERTRKEIESIKMGEAKKYAQSLVDKGILKPNDVDKLENYDTEGLITIQVAQLEKEKKELNERLRVVSKRIDHIERAYRKEERPLLAQDYQRQQEADVATFMALQEARKEATKRAHQEDLATKARLVRMMDVYHAHKEALLAKRGEEFAKKEEAARKKIEEEKEKRRKTVLKAWEEGKCRIEEEERIRREKEEEEQRQEEELRAEEERKHQEEEAERAAEEEKKRKEEEQQAAQRKEREVERQAAFEKARQQQQREDEAEERRRQRAAEKEKTSTIRRPVPTSTQNGDTWRRAATDRPESPAPSGAKYKVGAAQGAEWRAREKVKQQPAANPVQALPPPLPKKEEPVKDNDGFQVVSEKKPGVWRPKRGRV
ncbi:translation initiation factor eIF3a [Amanita muscaria]